MFGVVGNMVYAHAWFDHAGDRGCGFDISLQIRKRAFTGNFRCCSSIRLACAMIQTYYVKLRSILDAWILTSGYKEDAIAELIGEIVYKKQLKNAKINFSAIAVGKWGNTSNRSKL